MATSRIKVRFKCGECAEVHDYEDDARECCRPTVHEIYTCPVCNKDHECEDQAGACCGFDVVRCPSCARDYGTGHINYFAITVAGHCNTCNPFFTVEQQMAIEDSHIQASTDWNYVGLNK